MFKKLLLNVFFTFLLIGLLTSCGNIDELTDKKTINFTQVEVEENKEIIQKILDFFEIKDSEIICKAHFRFGRQQLSKEINSESYEGNSGLLQGPPDMEGVELINTKSNSTKNNSGNYSNFRMSVNYDKSGKKRISLDYISYLIIIDSQYGDKKPYLEKALKGSVVNRERGDLLTVIIKQ